MEAVQKFQKIKMACAENGEKEKANRFLWTAGDKVEILIECLAKFKSTMEYNNCDFNADKVKQYEAVREAMARVYEDQPSYFGPISVPELDEDDLQDEGRKKMAIKNQKEAREQIKKGYIRVKEKLKEIRQNFSNAITTGSRSGSGKIVLKHFDKLKQIWGGNPATQPLSIGISSIEVNEGNEESDMKEIESVSVLSPAESSSLSDGSGATDIDSLDSSIMNNTQQRKIGQKRKMHSNPVPKLIDNKRKHMERQLSAAQRDELLINEAKEDSQFKKSLAEAIQQSNETFAQSMQQMSMSIMQVAQGLSRSMEIMSQALVQQLPYNFQNPSTPMQYNGGQNHTNYYQNAAMNYPTRSNFQGQYENQRSNNEDDL